MVKDTLGASNVIGQGTYGCVNYLYERLYYS